MVVWLCSDPEVQVMVATPALTPVTSPVEFTVATAVSALLQLALAAILLVEPSL